MTIHLFLLSIPSGILRYLPRDLMLEISRITLPVTIVDVKTKKIISLEVTDESVGDSRGSSQ